LGYGADDLAALRATLLATPADIVVAGTRVDLGALLDIDRPVVRARYDYADAGTPALWPEVERRLEALR
jgi:predicted GTPase